MAKTKNKPSVTKEKVSKDKEIKKSKKEEPVTEAISEPVSESVKETKSKAKAKKKVVEVSIETKIYGDEPVKVVVPFPNSDLQTQTKKIITDFRIDVTRLPENVVVAINDMVTDFSTFVTNPNMFNLVSVIMEKDTTAFNLLKDWSDSRQELLIQNKNEKEKDEQNFPTEVVQPTAPPLHTQSAFTPLIPSALPKIAPVIDKEKIHKDYCVSIFNLIQNCFQMCHWKYIPMSELQTLIGNCDKQYKYEIVNQGDNSYVVVSTDSLTEKTNTFSIR